MMSFETNNLIWFLWLLPVLFVFFLAFERKRARKLFAFFGEALLQRLANYSVWGRRLQFLFFILALVLFLLAAMKPYSGVETIEIKRSGVDLYFLVDVSPSMLAQDIKPSRIERARFKIFDFLDILQGDRVGLVAFSGEAFVLTPLTVDYETFRIFANELDPSLFLVPGTNIAEAIEKAVQSFAKLSETSSKAIILFSDGEDSLGLSDEVIEKIRETGVQVYVVGLGTTEGAPVPNWDGGYKNDASGRLVLSRLDESTLQNLAQVTGGGYVRATAGDADLRQIYQNIKNVLVAQELASQNKKIPNYLFQIFIGAGLVCFLLELVISHKKIRMRRRRFFSFFAFCLLFVLANPVYAKNPFSFESANRDYENGDYAQAHDKLSQIQKDNPDDTDVVYNLGNTLYKLGEYSKADDQYKSALNSTDSQIRRNALYNLGNSAFRQNRLEESLKFFEQAMALDPDFLDAKINHDFVKKRLEQKQEEEQKQDQKPDSDDDKTEQNSEKDNQDSTNQDDTKQQESDSENSQSDGESKKQQNSETSQSDENSAERKEDQDEAKNSESGQEKPEHDESLNDQQSQDLDAKNTDGNEQQPMTPDDQQQTSQAQIENPSETDLQKANSWLDALQDDPSDALKKLIQKKSSSSPKNFDKDW